MDKQIDSRLRREFFVVDFDFGWVAYQTLLEWQLGRCAICQKPPEGKRLSVDHSHKTGLLRGLLCFRCNRAYGLFHDENPFRLRRAADYLTNPPATSCFGRPLYTAPGELGSKKRKSLLKKMHPPIVKLATNQTETKS